MQRRRSQKSSFARSVTPGSYDERTSQSSKKSNLSRDGVRDRPGKWLKLREYLLLLVEASLSMAAYVIGTRNITRRKREINSTTVQVEIFTQYTEGYSTLLTMFIGCIADSWLRHYTMALFSVVLHFAATCVILMEEVVERSQQHNPYTELVWKASVAAMVLIQSSDFTRLVYGLEGMTNRQTSTIFLFIFLHFWVSSYATNGGLFVNVFSGLFLYFEIDHVFTAFVLCSLSLFLFVYLLSPETDAKENRGLGCRVVGCFSLASYYKIFRIRKQWQRVERSGFLENTEGTFTRTTISRTKELLETYVLLLPTFGITFFVTIRANLFYRRILEKIKPEEYIAAVGLNQLARVISSIGMLIAYFVFWPFLTLMMGVKDKQYIKFLVGHFMATVTFFYAAILMKEIESFPYPPGNGFVRFFNTRENTVRFTSEYRDFTIQNFSVDPKKAEMVSYPSSKTMFMTAMRVEFVGTNHSFVTFVAIMPYKTIGYIILEPPEVVRIRGPFLPLREGPPGTNGWEKAKIFIYNTAKSFEGSTVIIKYAHKKEIIREVVLLPGTMTTIALTPGLYDFTILRGDVKKIVDIRQGALYGLMIYATTTSRGIAVDTVIGPNTASAWPYLGMYFVSGFAKGMCYPSLRAMIFSIAPEGLLAMSFAFPSFLEGISLWVAYIGFQTWHIHVVGNHLIAYASCLTLFFIICTYIILKYNDRYNT